MIQFKKEKNVYDRLFISFEMRTSYQSIFNLINQFLLKRMKSENIMDSLVTSLLILEYILPFDVFQNIDKNIFEQYLYLTTSFFKIEKNYIKLFFGFSFRDCKLIIQEYLGLLSHFMVSNHLYSYYVSNLLQFVGTTNENREK